MNYYKFSIGKGVNEVVNKTLSVENRTFVRDYIGGKNVISFAEYLNNLDAEEGLPEIVAELEGYLENDYSFKVELYDDVLDRTYGICNIPKLTKVTFTATMNPHVEEEEPFLFTRNLEVK